MTPKTIEQALNLIPTHIMLRPDEQRPSDEFFNDAADIWQTIEPEDLISDYLPRRRAIPDAVRLAMAEKLLNRAAGGENLRALFDKHNPFESWLAIM